MFRTTTLATLSALALSGCIATPASAQYLYGNLHGDSGHGYSYSHHDHGHSYEYHHDSNHDYHHSRGNYYGYGHVAYPATALSRHHAIPIYAGTDCPYGNDTVCSAPIDCPLQRGRALPNRLNDAYQLGFGLGDSGHDHSHGGNGHSPEGHSHEGHSHDRQNPEGAVAPSDRGYLAPPSLPPGSTYDATPQQDFRRDQPQRDDSLRIDSPPPSTLGPSSAAPPSSESPKRFNTPPPSTL